ncbi:MAG: hypothetical protein HOG15_14980 [Anaerolineae bacterium]|jgi:hypothetical protein|nr:hypothetical protein [Anaerolineae bacterium]MBT4459956.1 hypothetical protein [Anaerolineae bacterium]MBT6062145.1 hypothetical protein [Anaerolineae bacterium]MBT7190609.1 hypothetical protein [Anaerolineae bacterium]MBT7714495.1 hypothetical protein [Deltaproteobacteria bacterium]
MNNPLHPETLVFNEKQRRQLGQVYSLILSWRNEANQKSSTEPIAGEKLEGGSIVPEKPEKMEQFHV